MICFSFSNQISRMTYRAVTPFTGDPSLEYLHVIAENHPVVIDEWDENSERDDSSTTVKESKKIKYKRRSHIRKCSETQSEKSICSFKPELSSESDNKCEMEIIANNCNSVSPGHICDNAFYDISNCFVFLCRLLSMKM